MHIIPVIDLLNGEVVHAKKGERKYYQAIQSKLTASTEPVRVVEALLSVYPFTQLYIADLNAIQKSDVQHPNNYAHILKIQQTFPQLSLWLDVGISKIDDLSHWLSNIGRLVLGSENIDSMTIYHGLMQNIEDPILSLDFLANGYKGPEALLTQTQNWPKDVIVMTLAEVGTSIGPNIARISQIKNASSNTNIIAAGGIRDKTDLIQLKQMGITSALVATALHQQQLSHADIHALHN